MPTTLLASPLVLAQRAQHAQADVEHFLYELLSLSDLTKSLVKRDVYSDDVRAVLEQLLDERPAEEGEVSPTRSPRLRTVHDLALRRGGTSVDVLMSVAAALPRELAFLRRPLEESAHDVGALYDGALASKGGAMTFRGWDPDLRTCMATMQALVDTKWKSWAMTPLALLLTLLCAKRYYAPLEARGIRAVTLIEEIGNALPQSHWRRPPPGGHQAGIGPALYATILRAEHYAADDASDVRLRHVLTALHDEPELAPFVATIAG